MTTMTLEEGVKFFFDYKQEKYPDFSLYDDEYCKYIRSGEKDIPVFAYRTFPKFEEMKNLTLLGEKCALTVSSAAKEPIERIVFRELDVAEYLLDSQTEHVTAYHNGNSINLIIAMENGTKASMQIHSSSYGDRQFRHELFTKEGMVSDRVVDTVIAQQSLNIYTENGFEAITDADMLLYGLSPEGQEYVYGIYDAFHGDRDALTARAERLKKITQLVLACDRTFYSGSDF